MRFLLASRARLAGVDLVGVPFVEAIERLFAGLSLPGEANPLQARRGVKSALSFEYLPYSFVTHSM